ncbi:NADPH:quinone reductase [Herbiconiux daphne]|uniref:NADPH:quinone reductase n=1 Tax=Herbiconiux daphne TaxID=2970914 RepID=A0ABT2GY57_9MICO|nr:NADPH:quinone reductase [Herbiconiux daphne]MCS5732885.1 NADPH:quinone reductase [Herbiconiux daphne]
MKSIAYFEPGSVDVLQLIERPVPDPGPGEVRIRVIVAGVNPTDIDARRNGRGERFSEPHVPGQDGAGIIDAVGEGVDRLHPGDRVWLWDAAWRRSEGTAQEYVVVPAIHVVALPDHVGFEIGASLGIPALTAHRTLTSFAGGPSELRQGSLEGRAVLVAGGAGAVGHAAIQLAVWAGAEVITTVSDETKAALARAAGAHHVVDYRHTDAATEIRRAIPRGPQIVVEVNARVNLPMDVSVIAPNGGISIYTPGGDSIVVPSRSAMTKNIQMSFVLTYTTTAAEKQAAVRSVNAAVASGALGVGEEAGLPITRFPLAETAAAHAAVENHAVGKVLIDVADER